MTPMRFVFVCIAIVVQATAETNGTSQGHPEKWTDHPIKLLFFRKYIEGTEFKENFG
jgi:hypothetical protein